jgi:hypothetical protein
VSVWPHHTTAQFTHVAVRSALVESRIFRVASVARFYLGAGRFVGYGRASPELQLDRTSLLSSHLLKLVSGIFIPDFFKKRPNRI